MPSPQSQPRAAAPKPEPLAAATAAHDLKNLLAVILGVCETLAERCGADAEAGELARVALLAAQRAGRLADRLQGPPPRHAPALVRPEGPGQTVLIIDDDPDLLQLMTTAFARAGYKAYAASNGRAGVQLLGQVGPDLVVTDIVMPQKEGIAVIIEVKALAPDAGLIAISGGGAYGRSGNFLQWAEELGADAALAKPFLMSELVATARRVLDAKAARAAG
jgi:CheY-like chemotaxis protein